MDFWALIIVGVWSSFFTVDVSEEGVVTRFGKYVKTAPSGLHTKLPFGIDKVTIVQSKNLQEEFVLELSRRATNEASIPRATSKPKALC